MSRIPGTPDSVKRVNKLSLYKNKKKKYNLQLESHENTINNFLNSSKSNNLIEISDLSEKDFTKFLHRLDGYNGLFTNSQLGNIDFSKFEEHVFFDSAASKVINAYQDIFNNYPYDQDYFKNVEFLSKIDGYTKYVLNNQFEKSFGQLKFDGNHKVIVKDQRGFLLKDHSNRTIGFLNPGLRKFSFNFWLLLKSDNTLASNNNQIIFKKFDSTNNNESGFICYLSKETNSYYVNLLVVNKGIKYGKKCLLITQADMDDQASQSDNQIFKNIYISVENESDSRDISFYVNGHDLLTSSITNTDNNLSISDFSDTFKTLNTTFTIGHSESLTFNGITFNSLNKVSLDEFRYYFKSLSQKEIAKYMHKNIYSQKGLVMYLKFNEPAGGYTNHNVTLDSSGNKLHGYIVKKDGSDWINSSSIRQNLTPMTHEKEMPVLFSSYPGNATKRSNLLTKADSYDKVNPNIIFKLFPKHYFVENSELQDISLYTNTSDYNANNNGVGVTKANNSMMTNLLLVWARFFDSIKCYIDSISEVINVNYDTINENRNLGIILPLLCKRAGFEFREILPSPLQNKLDGENLTFDDIKSENTIRNIQNVLWKRILINSKNYLQQKGTRNSIKNIFHSFGLEFDKFIDIREFTSTNTVNVSDNYSSQQKTINSISFLNEDLRFTAPTYADTSSNSFSNNRLYVTTSNIKRDLTVSYDSLADVTKIESSQNGLSAEWTIEFAISYNELFKSIIKNNQSLLRINNSSTNDPIMNLKAYRDNAKKDTFTLSLDFIAHSNLASNKYLNLLTLSDINLFEGMKYINVSQRKIEGNIYEISILVQDAGNRNLGIIPKKSSIILDFSSNVSFLNKSDHPIRIDIGNYNYLNTVSSAVGIGQITNTNFDGSLCMLRVWKKHLLEEEVKSHYLDLDNVSTNDLELDKNLILDSKLKFIIESSDISTSGGVQSSKIKNFRIYKKVYVSDVYEDMNNTFLKVNNTTLDLTKSNKKIGYISKKLSFKIDEPNSENRFNIVSYQNDDHKDFNKNYNSFPSFDVPENFDKVNDARVSIEISNSRFLNEDITKMMSSIESFTDDIITTSNLYSYEYNKVKEKRNQYFKILDKEINNKTLINFFKYFDNALSNMISEAIPNKVGFLGFNYVYESHALERHKYEYKMSDSRVVVSDYGKNNFNREVEIGFRSRDYINNRKQITSQES